MTNNAAITALTTEIRPLRLHDGHDDPALIYSLVDDRRYRLTSGFSTLSRAEFDISCYSDSYNTAKDLANTARAELENYSGAFGANQVEQIDISSEFDMFEDETKTYRVMLTITVWYA